jgi:hypothetical protein
MIEGTDKYYCRTGNLLQTVQAMNNIPVGEIVLVLDAHPSWRSSNAITLKLLWCTSVVSYRVPLRPRINDHDPSKLIYPGMINYFKLLRSGT